MTNAIKEGEMTLEMIFDEFPLLETRFAWNEKLVKSFIASGLLMGYINSYRHPVVIRKSLIYVYEHMIRVNRLHEIDEGDEQ